MTQDIGKDYTDSNYAKTASAIRKVEEAYSNRKNIQDQIDKDNSNNNNKDKSS